MKVNNILIGMILAAMLLVGCGGGDYTPKPQAYLRIDMPEHSYTAVDTVALPIVFERSVYADVVTKKLTRQDVWVDLNYPQWDGVVFLTYKRLNSPADLRGQIDTSSRLVEKHYQFASGIDEQSFDSDDGTVHAATWHLKGNKVASTYQFYATDSTHNFLRGALYLNRTPNNDSLAPVLEYIQEDIEHLVETLRWRQ